MVSAVSSWSVTTVIRFFCFIFMNFIGWIILEIVVLRQQHREFRTSLMSFQRILVTASGLWACAAVSPDSRLSARSGISGRDMDKRRGHRGDLLPVREFRALHDNEQPTGVCPQLQVRHARLCVTDCPLCENGEPCPAHCHRNGDEIVEVEKVEIAVFLW